jgi:hypothetical protein
MSDATLIERISNNPNPRRGSFFPRWILASIAWGRTLNRDAAIDSLKNVFAIVGVCAAVAMLDTMHLWMIPPALLMIAGCWYGDYIRHF